MILISVIVPFYNAVNVLEKAVKSILSQTYTCFEIVLIDDGSNDGSKMLAENLALADNRIKLFSQTNQGVSAARNLGLQNSSGEYIMFVDADDWIDEHMMEDIFRHLNEFKNVDLVRLRNQKVFTRDSKLLNDKQYNVKLYEPLAFIKENLMGGYICSLFIKTDIIKHNNLRFSSDMKFMEDQEFSLKCFLHAKRILYYDKPHYFYYQSESSASLSNIKNVVANSADILKCGGRVYQYAIHHASAEIKPMVKKYALQKIHQYFKINIRYKAKSTSMIASELRHCLTDIGIGAYQMGYQNLLYYLIIKSGLRSLFTKS